MKADVEHIGEVAIFTQPNGARFLGVLTTVHRDGSMDVQVMYTDIGYGWEIASKPWKMRFTEAPDIEVIE